MTTSGALPWRRRCSWVLRGGRSHGNGCRGKLSVATATMARLLWDAGSRRGNGFCAFLAPLPRRRRRSLVPASLASSAPLLWDAGRHHSNAGRAIPAPLPRQCRGGLPAIPEPPVAVATATLLRSPTHHRVPGAHSGMPSAAMATRRTPQGRWRGSLRGPSRCPGAGRR